MGAKALLFADEDDLVDLKGKLNDALPFLSQFTQTTNLITFFKQVNTDFRTTPRETNAQTESLIQAIPALTLIVAQAIDRLGRPGTPPSPSVTSLFNAGSELNIYINYDRGRIFLVTAHAPSDKFNGQAIERLRQLVRENKPRCPALMSD